MQSLAAAVRPRFVQLLNRPSLKPLSLRAFSSSSSDYANQSRGGLPRFFSQVLPPSKAVLVSPLLHSISIHIYMPLAIGLGGIVRVEGDEFWHMTKVLRLSTNDRVELFNGKGGLIEGCIQRIDRTGLDVVALEDPKLVLPQHTQWNVFAAFGTLKGGRADWLVEKCTELGAQSVTPLLTERSPSISENRTYSDNGFLSCNFYYGFIANSAFVYGGQRLHEMVLNPPMKIDGLLPLVSQSKLAFVAIAEATPLVTALSSSRNESSGLIIVGPEGDFTEKEVNKIVEAGATAVGLGPHRLRVETATIALLATLMLCSDSQQMPIP
ncbi:16S rRNA (uracil(1498)-N(3))-methyltransferase [Citrus sinensis]|uniref:16S rRNA (Uracil(1498)-N(3))-methyltransferase n=1 Tax=Citrus sinensis TaxID=2711 RepID=A0ACB8IDG7_CITSI|nr:16S rRNA (uracil(1498)-N(3))-methyltransferase [Citrus sinensis]